MIIANVGERQRALQVHEKDKMAKKSFYFFFFSVLRMGKGETGQAQAAGNLLLKAKHRYSVEIHRSGTTANGDVASASSVVPEAQPRGMALGFRRAV